MFFSIYVSSAVELFSEKELVDLLEISRKNNHAVGLTGMLLYKDGNFMQFLEGEKSQVKALMVKIEKDPRHTGLITLLEQESDRREFSEWAMGFKKLGPEALAEVPGYSDFMNTSLMSEQFVSNPSQSLKLLLKFRDLMR
jgi:hypothetical protein